MKSAIAAAFLLIASAASEQEAAYGPQLEGYDYPFPLQHYRFQSQDMAMDMAYMDVKPAMPNGHTVCFCMARISVPRPGKAASGR